MGGEDAKLEFKIRVAACTQDRIQALLRMEDAVLRDSLIKGHDIIWLPQAGWPGTMLQQTGRSEFAYRACRMDSVTNSDVSEGIGTK